MSTWSRRLSAAQAKQPGTARRPEAELARALPEGVLPDDLAALRVLAGLARSRPGYEVVVPVRRATPDGTEDLTVTVRHADGKAAVRVADAGSRTAPQADTAIQADGPPDGSGDRILDMLTDALVLTSDIVAVFESVGAEALWANDAFATAIQAREADRIWLIDLLDEWSKAHFEVNVLPALVQHGRWHGRLVLLTGDEDAPELPVTVSLVAHRDASGEIEAVTMVARDLRPLHEAEARIRASASPLAALVERSSDIVVVIDPDARVLYASPATTRLLALPDGELDGSVFFDRVHPDDLQKFDDLRDLTTPGEDGVPPSTELRLSADDGAWRVVEAVAADLTDNPAVGGVVLTARDITDRVEEVQRLADRAYTDPVTLLPNRVRLLDRLGAALQDASDRSIVVLLYDIDDFDALVERHGAADADRLLRLVGDRLADETRPHDVVARLEGSTFAMVMREVSDLDGALVAADRIKNRLSDPYRLDGTPVGLTVSVGITVARRGQAPEEVLADADAAVGIAAQHGGDRVEVLTAELRSSAARRRDMEDLMRRALTEGTGLGLHYQPVFAVDTGAITSAEALLRVHDDEGALLNPASFIEAAEGSGLINALGTQVLQLACDQLARWLAEPSPDTPREVSVNVSPRQLADPAFPTTVAAALEQFGVEPGQLCLEITESMMIGDRGVIDETVAALRELGVRIGLDDFGAGQGSLGYLKRFSLDFVKIDRELVAGLGSDEHHTAVVRATVDLAHSLGLVVGAVGVENQEQLEILGLLGVDRAQGFHFAPAVPATELAERVRSQT